MAATPTIRRIALGALALALACGLATRSSGAATSSTVVGATVPSAITLQDGCTHAEARSFGTVLPGASVLTATGANVCRYTFESSNASSMLRLYQADRTTQAMVGTPSSWTQRQPSDGNWDLAHAGTALIVAQNAWGVAGQYQRSLDGGASWAAFAPGGGATPQVSAPSSTVAWRLGDGIARRSTDMQAPTPSWSVMGTTVAGGESFLVGDAEAISASTVWVANNGTRVFRTADAGATNWSSADTSGCVNAGVIDAVSASTAFVVGYGRICRSIDSNASWTHLTSGLTGFEASDVQASPQTPTTIWAVGAAGKVARSTDNGATWTQVTSTPIPVGLHTLEVVSDTEARVGGRDGLAFRTTDSGGSWTRWHLPTNAQLRSFVLPTATSAVVSGTAGVLEATVDDGTTWSTISGTGALRDLDGVDSGLLVGAGAKGRVMTTSDGGATTTYRATGLGFANVRGVALTDSSTIIVVGDQGRVALSNDAGATWTTRPSGTTQDLWDVSVDSEGVAIAVGAGGTILRSSDRGWNWSVRASTGPDLRRVDVRSGAPMLAVGLGGTIRRSTDRGVTWTSPTSGTTDHLTGVGVASDLVAYASAPGRLLKSVDGGATWTSSALADWLGGHLSVVSPEVLWVSSDFVQGWMPWTRVSTDGGATFTQPWTNHDPGVTALHATDAGTVFWGFHAGALRSSNPPSTLTDYTGGAWAGAGSVFGACLQDVGGSAAFAAWAEDLSGTCTASDSDSWYPVPTAPVKVAQMAAAGTGTVDLVWGFKAGAATAPGTYTAGVVVEALAPNA